jgi:hypothetical protein
MKKQLKKIAHKIMELEKLAELEPNFDYSSEMEKLIEGLDISDLLAIDEYIQTKLLTK